MDSCPYYHEVRVDDAKAETIPCCRHKHTPAPCLMAMLLTERPHALKCTGRLSRCQIPAYLQLDIS